MKASVIEQIKVHSDLYRKERDEFFIRKLNTYDEGIEGRLSIFVTDSI